MNRIFVVILLAALRVASAAPPSPEQFFGHRMGADRTVLEWSKVVSYFNTLANNSDRVKVQEYGKSTEGRPMIAAFISSPDTLRRLPKIQAAQLRLADPRSTTMEEADRIAADGKAVVLITCSVHATELASTATAIEFAHKLATSNDPKIQRILNDVLIILAPSINPDGLDLVSAWYKKTLGTPFEGTNPPELYQKYVGHDNNRDWYIFSQAETRAIVSKLHNAWRPQVVYDVHQMGATGARIFVPPWLDPIEPNIDSLIAQECNMVGMIMATDLTAAGRKGVLVNAVYDFWTPARNYQSFHGGLRILSESASARLATPLVLKPDQVSSLGTGYSPRERSWNYLEPWLGGEWRVRDIVDDQMIAMESLCSAVSARREEFLKGFYSINRRAAERKSPFAYVVPAVQSDPAAAKKMLETLDFGLVEIEKAQKPFKAGDKLRPASTYVIRMQQPYSSFAKALLERQQYPDLRLYPGGPPKRPYDVAAHTLPLLMGVSVEAIEGEFQASLAKVKEFGFAYDGAPPQGALPASDSESWKKINAAWKSGTPVWRDPRSGDFYLGARKPAGAEALRKPKVALYKSWMPSMDEGWTRWILEQFGWEFESVGNSKIRAGDLAARFDAIVFADQSATAIADGFRQGAMPEQYTGGLGAQGAEALQKFVQAGGRLIFLNESGEYAPVALGAKVKDAIKGVSNKDVYSPGSLLNVRLEPGHPLGLGLPAEFTVWNEQSPVWEPEEGAGRAVVRYSQAPVLASGWLLGEKYMAGKPAVVELRAGSGKIMLFGMRPQYRAQSYLTLKLLFNALVY